MAHAWIRWNASQSDLDRLKNHYRFSTLEEMRESPASVDDVAHVHSLEAWFIFTSTEFLDDGISVIYGTLEDREDAIEQLLASMVWVNNHADFTWPEERKFLVATKTGRFGESHGAVIELIDGTRVVETKSIRASNETMLDRAIVVGILEIRRLHGYKPTFQKPLTSLDALRTLKPSRPGDVVMVKNHGSYAFDSNSTLPLGEDVEPVLDGTHPGRWIRLTVTS